MGNDKRREVTNRIISLLEQTDISQGYPNLYQRIKEWIDEIPTEAQNGERVSRKDAIDALMSLPRWVIDSNGEYQPVDANTSSMIDPEDAVSAIENLPSIQSETLRINLNEWVKVKLTDLGKEIYYHQYDNINKAYGREMLKSSFLSEDEDGYTRFQLWKFIQLYGSHIGMGAPNVIDPLEIVYEGKINE